MFISDLSHIEVVTDDNNIQGGHYGGHKYRRRGFKKRFKFPFFKFKRFFRKRYRHYYRYH